jgi:hypothetical protein
LSRDDDFVCPNCGADLPGNAKFCPECGSDDKTGWSEDTYLDGVSLPGEDDGGEDTPTGTLDKSRPIWVVAAVVLLAAAALFLLGILRS